MRCDSCGRVIKNHELWRLANTREAAAYRSFDLLCEECLRQVANQSEAPQVELVTVEAILGPDPRLSA